MSATNSGMSPFTLAVHNITNAGFRVDIQVNSTDPVEERVFLFVQHLKLKNEMKTMKGPDLAPLLEQAERYATNYCAFVETMAGCGHVH